MARAFESHAEAGIALAEQAVAMKPESAELLYCLAAAYWEAGREKEFADCFRRAYLLRQIAALASEEAFTHLPGAPADRRDRAKVLLDHGVYFPGVIGEMLAAEAKLGNTDAIDYLVDFKRFFRHGRIAPPAAADAE